MKVLKNEKFYLHFYPVNSVSFQHKIPTQKKKTLDWLILTACQTG